MYHTAGMRGRKCGSLARSDRPLAERLPATTQLLLAPPTKPATPATPPANPTAPATPAAAQESGTSSGDGSGSLAEIQVPASTDADSGFVGSTLERSKLTGDWLGLRTTLADRGITFDISSTQFYQGVASGGLEQSFPYGGRNDYFLTLDGEKLGLWKAIEIARHQQAKSLELRPTVSLTRLWQRQDKKEEAHEMLADIYGWFTEGFDTKDLREAKALLDELSSGGR